MNRTIALNITLTITLTNSQTWTRPAASRKDLP